MNKYAVNLLPVHTFMVAARQIQPDHPGSYDTVPSISTAIKTLEFVASELQELRDALMQYQADPNPAALVDVAKEWADVMYTAGNVAVALNLPASEVFEAVCVSNTSKFNVCDCENGCSLCVWTGLVSADRTSFKVPKGPNYRPANDAILHILQKHRRVRA